MSKKQIISSFSNRDEFLQLLTVNPGLIIIKFGATWCGPCKRIAPLIEGFFLTSPDNVICADIDVDESFDLFSFLKSKRMIDGIPAIFCYKRGTTSWIPDDSVVGADPVELDAFFKRCGKYLK
jgi:thioredoxin 1